MNKNQPIENFNHICAKYNRNFYSLSDVLQFKKTYLKEIHPDLFPAENFEEQNRKATEANVDFDNLVKLLENKIVQIFIQEKINQSADPQSNSRPHEENKTRNTQSNNRTYQNNKTENPHRTRNPIEEYNRICNKYRQKFYSLTEVSQFKRTHLKEIHPDGFPAANFEEQNKKTVEANADFDILVKLLENKTVQAFIQDKIKKSEYSTNNSYKKTHKTAQETNTDNNRRQNSHKESQSEHSNNNKFKILLKYSDKFSTNPEFIEVYNRYLSYCISSNIPDSEIKSGWSEIYMNFQKNQRERDRIIENEAFQRLEIELQEKLKAEILRKEAIEREIQARLQREREARLSSERIKKEKARREKEEREIREAEWAKISEIKKKKTELLNKLTKYENEFNSEFSNHAQFSLNIAQNELLNIKNQKSLLEKSKESTLVFKIIDLRCKILQKRSLYQISTIEKSISEIDSSQSHIEPNKDSSSGAVIGSAIGGFLGLVGGFGGAVLGAALGGVIGAGISSSDNSNPHNSELISKKRELQNNRDDWKNLSNQLTEFQQDLMHTPNNTTEEDISTSEIPYQ